MKVDSETQMKSYPEQLSISDDFPPVSYDQWRAVAEGSLGGAPFERKLVTHTYEGIDIQPIYTRRDQLDEGDVFGFPGCSPFVRGAQPLGSVRDGWDLRVEHAHPDVATTNLAILADLEGGATSVHLRFDAASSSGMEFNDPAWSELAGHGGVMIFDVESLAQVLDNVRPELVTISLDAGAAFLPAAAALMALWERRHVSADQARAALNADPLAALAREGQLHIATEKSLAQLGQLAHSVSGKFPHVTSVGVDTSPYHDAGATAAQDIAMAMATATEYLRAMAMDTDDAARQFVFRVGIGTHHFLAIAKLRAYRQLWDRIVRACGGSGTVPIRLHARTSNRVMTRRDPHVNLLRNTCAVFAAGIGGADAITPIPFDAMSGLPSAFSRRIARNTLLVLQEEGHLHRVVDPAGGSWFIDRLTEQLSEKAWAIFQEIERQGGMAASLTSGWIAGQIDQSYAPRAKDIAIRKQGITGVSEFPDASESRLEQPLPDVAALQQQVASRIKQNRNGSTAQESAPKVSIGDLQSLIESARRGATLGQMATAIGFRGEKVPSILPIEPRYFAEPFEELRDASDQWRNETGHAPRVFLANLGPIAHHTARANYAKNFFEAGGFEVVTNDGFSDGAQAAEAFQSSGAGIAVICSSDQLYADLVPDAAAALKKAGARSVVLAGHPGSKGPDWQVAGVDRFIFIKCDVLETLRALLREEGVLKHHEK